VVRGSFVILFSMFSYLFPSIRFSAIFALNFLFVNLFSKIFVVFSYLCYYVCFLFLHLFSFFCFAILYIFLYVSFFSRHYCFHFYFSILFCCSSSLLTFLSLSLPSSIIFLCCFLLFFSLVFLILFLLFSISTFILEVHVLDHSRSKTVQQSA
jgi:hypothetical protein